jgi:hypothetical protein
MKGRNQSGITGRTWEDNIRMNFRGRGGKLWTVHLAISGGLL